MYLCGAEQTGRPYKAGFVSKDRQVLSISPRLAVDLKPSEIGFSIPAIPARQRTPDTGLYTSPTAKIKSIKFSQSRGKKALKLPKTIVLFLFNGKTWSNDLMY